MLMYASRHPILDKLEDLRWNWSEFNQLRDKLRTQSSDKVLDHLVDVGIVTPDERRLIDEHWARWVRPFCSRFLTAFELISDHHAPELTLRMIVGVSHQPCAIIHHEANQVIVLVVTGDLSDGTVRKLTRGEDSGFVYLLRKQHRELEQLLSRTKGASAD